MNAPVFTTTISRLTALSDELLVNKDGSTALQRTADLAAQIAGEGAVAAALQSVRNDVSVSIDEMESKLEGAAAGSIEASTWAQLLSRPGTRLAQPGYVPSTDTGTHVDPVNGFTVSNGGKYSWSGSAWERIGDAVDARTVVDIGRRVGSVARSAVTDKPPVSGLNREVVVANNTWLANRYIDPSFGGWQVGVVPKQRMAPSHFFIHMLFPTDAASLTLQIFKRRADVDGPFTPADTVLMAETTFGPEVGFVAGSEEVKELKFDISGIDDVLDPAFLYGFFLRAKNSSGAYTRVYATAGRVLVGGLQSARGYIRNFTTGNFSALALGSAVSYRVTGKDMDAVDSVNVDVKNLQRALGARINTEVLGTPISTNYPTSFNYQAWQVGWNPAQSCKNLRLTTRLVRSATTISYRLLVWQRPMATGDSSIGETYTAFGNDPTDVLVYEQYFTVAGLGLEVEVPKDVLFNLQNLGVLQPDYIYGFSWHGIAANGAPSIMGIAKGPDAASATPNWKRGAYMANPNWNRISSVGTIGIVVEVDQTEVSQKISRPTKETVISEVSDTMQSLTSFSFNMAAMSVARTGQTLAIPATAITIDQPTFEDIGSAPTTLTSGVVEGSNLPSRYQYLGPTVTVVRTSDSVTLVENVDYSISRNRGVLARTSGAANYAVTVSYRGYKHRYDLVVADANTGVVSVVKGTDTVVDPESFKPALPAGSIALFMVYAWRDGVDIIPVHKFQDHVHVDRRTEYQEMQARNKRLLAPVLARAVRGQPITLAGYGDSITAKGGTRDLTPNGTSRDLFSFFARFSDEIKATIPKFDVDGTPNSAGLFDHMGWNWAIKAALERFGSTVTYLNFGIGGSTSANSINGTIYNGLHPDRMAPLLASGSHLVVIAFGMNELGSSTTYANMRSIIEQLKGVGSLPLVVTPPRPNILSRSSTDWLKTHDELVRVAYDTNVPVVSLYDIFGPGQEGAFGFSPKNMCNQNIVNHPSIEEFRCINEMVSRPFLA